MYPAYKDPILSMYAVADDYDFNDPSCENAWICRPNIAPSSIAVYNGVAIPEWQNSLLVVSLKRGYIYQLPLTADGSAVTGGTTQFFYTQNRYRDIAISPDGKSIFLLTDARGNMATADGLGLERDLRNRGAILRFDYMATSSTVSNAVSRGVEVFPNPASGSFQLELAADLNLIGATASVLDGTGRLVKNVDQLTSGANRVEVGELPSGVYFVRVRLNSGGVAMRRVVLL